LKNHIEILNPFIKTFNEINNEISEIYSEQEKLEDDLVFFIVKKNSIGEIEKIVESLSYRLTINNEKLNTIQSQLDSKRKEQIILKKLQKSPVNPLYYLSSSQNHLKLRQKGLKRDIIETLTNFFSISEANKSCIETIRGHQNDIVKYNSLDVNKIKENIESNSYKIIKLKGELAPITKQKDKLDKHLKPLINEIIRIEGEIKIADSDKSKAEKYNEDLDNASNGYERKMVHEKCQEVLGEGNPNTIIKKNSHLIDKLERDLKKLRKRAEDESKKFTRIIDEIVIDGNNMAYESDVFIGLKALIKATSILQKDYKVTVVFDSDIRGLLKKSNQAIQEEFNDSVKIHVVASKQKADETILDLVSDKKTHYVVSNDRFSDYFEKDAVKNKRIIRHEIINNLILINDLNLKESY
jgi:hypothetical protein